MAITKKEVLHLAKLSRLEITYEEAEDLKKDLNKILDYVAELDKINVSAIGDVFNVACLENQMRKDIIELDYKGRKAEMLGKILKEAPQLKDGYFEVPPILNKTDN